jgi:hypothetical protein
MLTAMTSEQAFLWILPALVGFCVVLQLIYGRVAVGPWRTIEKSAEEGRYWLFIVAESLLVLILIGQALSA